MQPSPKPAGRRSGQPAPISDRHNQASRRVDVPEAGYFTIRLIRGGPQVPAAIVNIDGMWFAVINGARHHSHADPAYAPEVFRIWLSGDRITQDDYMRRLEAARRPGALDPRKRKPDLDNLPPVF